MADNTCGGESVVVNGFTVVPVRFSEKSKCGHYLYLKEHRVRDQDGSKPRDRTLFVANIPPYVTEESLKNMLECCGQVENVFLHDKPTTGPSEPNPSKHFTEEKIKGFKVGYIVFKKSAALKKAKSLSYSQPLIISTKSCPVQTGMKKWIKQYTDSQVDVKALTAEIDSYMQDYDKRKALEKKNDLEKEGVADDEGWVTVTRHGKNKGAPRTDVHNKRMAAKERKKRQEKELLNFYSFQAREKKKEHIAHLRQRFEEDKQRISLMKAARKFRPY